MLSYLSDLVLRRQHHAQQQRARQQILDLERILTRVVGRFEVDEHEVDYVSLRDNEDDFEKCVPEIPSRVGPEEIYKWQTELSQQMQVQVRGREGVHT